MEDNIVYRGSCFCGAVQLEVQGALAAAGYCHCESCRKWSAGPSTRFRFGNPGLYASRAAAIRSRASARRPTAFKWCKACGGHLFTEHPPWELTDVCA